MKKRIFTQEEQDYIFKNWGKTSINKICIHLTCTQKTLEKFANENNLEKLTYNRWTEEHTKKLIEMSKNKTAKEIFESFNFDESHIRKIAKKNNIILFNPSKWTVEQSDYLIDNWGQKTIEYIARKINKTTTQVTEKAKNLKLGSTTEQEESKISLTMLETIFNVSKSNIKVTWVKKGLKIKKQFISKKSFYYYVTKKHLTKFLEKNPDLWNTKKTNLDFFDDTRINDKFLRDKIVSEEDKRIRPPATIKERIYIEQLHQKGYTYEEISRITNRNEGIIRGYIQRKISENKEYITLEKISQILNLNINIINHCWKAKGLKIYKKNIKSKVGYVKTNDLFLFLKDNKNIWQYQNIEEISEKIDKFKNDNNLQEIKQKQKSIFKK